MKKLLALVLCIMMSLAFAGCGKEEANPAGNEETASGQTQSEEASEPENDADGEIPYSAEVIAEMVDTFNNTDDSEVRRQLQEQLEEIFAQAEAASIGGISD